MGKRFIVRVGKSRGFVDQVNASTLRCDSCILDGKFELGDVVKSDSVEVILVAFANSVTFEQALKQFDKSGLKPVLLSIFLDFAEQNIGQVSFSQKNEFVVASNKKPQIVCLSSACTECEGKKCVVSFYRDIIGPYLFTNCVYYTDENGKMVVNTWKNDCDRHTAFLVMEK